jgi:hypothetical protein
MIIFSPFSKIGFEPGPIYARKYWAESQESLGKRYHHIESNKFRKYRSSMSLMGAVSLSAHKL